MAQQKSPLRVAISGGGLAGASLFHALLNQPHLDVHIFESAAEFREAGAAVGISNQAQTALSLMGPSALEAFKRAGAVDQKGAHLVLAEGPDAGETVGRIGGEQNATGIVHRAEFLRELLAGAPRESMHALKKLVKIEQPEGGPVTLSFSDDSKHECDVLIGADGIHSSVRKFILGDSDPAASPVPAGWWIIQVLKPYDEVAALMSQPFLDKYLNLNSPGEVGWIGDGSLIFHSPLSQSRLAQFVIASSHDEKSTDWQKTVSSREIREMFKNWPGELSNAVEKLICTEDSHTALCFWQHLPAKTYARGNVAITGDAAHATTPWQGSGAGMSVEDSMILSTLLGRATSVAEARVALQVFDSVRRERTQRVVESSMGTGLLATGQDPEAGLNAAKLRDALRPRWDFILGFDVEAHRDEAVGRMDAQVKLL